MKHLGEILLMLIFTITTSGSLFCECSKEVSCNEQNYLIFESVLSHFEQDSLIDCTTFSDSTVFDNSVLSLYTVPEYQEFLYLLIGLRELNQQTASSIEYKNIDQINCADYETAREVGFSQPFFSDDCALCIIYYQESFRGEAWGGFGSIVILERIANVGWKIKLTSNLWRS